MPSSPVTSGSPAPSSRIVSSTVSSLPLLLPGLITLTTTLAPRTGSESPCVSLA